MDAHERVPNTTCASPGEQRLEERRRGPKRGTRDLRRGSRSMSPVACSRAVRTAAPLPRLRLVETSVTLSGQSCRGGAPRPVGGAVVDDHELRGSTTGSSAVSASSIARSTVGTARCRRASGSTATSPCAPYPRCRSSPAVCRQLRLETEGTIAGARADDRRPPDRRRHGLLRDRGDRPQPPGRWRRPGAVRRRSRRASTRSSSRSATTATSSRGSSTTPVQQREQLRADLRGAPRGARARRGEYERAEGVRERARARLSSRRHSTPERRSSRGARRARHTRSRPGTSEHAASSARRSFGKPMFVSTGGATIEDVDRPSTRSWPINPQVCLLQCTAAYPAAVEELELGVIATYRERYPELWSGSPTTRTGSRCHWSPTCSARE